MTRDEMRELIAERVRARLRETMPALGTGLNAKVTAEAVTVAVRKLLGEMRHDLHPLPSEDFVTVETTPEDLERGVIRFSIRTPPEVLERMVQLQYAAGRTHEQVTAWLEECCPDFRTALACVAFDDGTQEWMLMAPTVEYAFTVKL